jgi:hypothetical protein
VDKVVRRKGKVAAWAPVCRPDVTVHADSKVVQQKIHGGGAKLGEPSE